MDRNNPFKGCAVLQITRQTEYGIKTMIELAQSPEGQFISARTISERQEIPETFLHKTLQLLSRAGLVVTQRGVQGGVRLAVAADKITILDILNAIEGHWPSMSVYRQVIPVIISRTASSEVF